MVRGIGSRRIFIDGGVIQESNVVAFISSTRSYALCCCFSGPWLCSVPLPTSREREIGNALQAEAGSRALSRAVALVEREGEVQ
jgi:hypothetical protein